MAQQTVTNDAQRTTNAQPARSSATRPSAFVFAILALFLALSVLYNVTLPVFEAPDEGDHFHYADYLARERRLPHLEHDLAASHEIIQPPLYYALVAAVIAPFDRTQLPAISRLNPDWFDPDVNADHRSVTNQYAHTAAEDFPYESSVWAVRAARLVSTLLGALTLLLVYAIARRLVPPSSSGRRVEHENKLPSSSGRRVGAEDKLPSPSASRAGGEVAPPLPSASGAGDESALPSPPGRGVGGEGKSAQLLPLLATALIALNPKFINISSIVSNDIAITFAATLACWWMVRVWRLEMRDWRRDWRLGIRDVGRSPNAIPAQYAGPQAQYVGPQSPISHLQSLISFLVLGALIGVAVLCKVTGLGLLVPAAALIAGMSVQRHSGWRHAIRFAALAGIAVGAGLALTAGWWFVYNVAHYAHPLAWAQVQAANQTLLRQPALTFVQMIQSIPEVLISYWGVLGIELRYPAWLNIVFYIALALAVIGCARIVRRATFNLRRDMPIALLVVWELTLLASYLLWLRDYVGTENSRLIFPGIALVVLLVAAGWLALMALTPLRLRRLASLGACVALASLSALTPFTLIRPAFEPPRSLGEQEIEALPGRTGVTFSGKIRLLHAQINQRSVQPGEAASVSLYWGALQPLSQSYHAVLTAHDAQGRLIGRREAIPFNGRFDTQRWEPGKLYRDDYQLPIDANAPRGVATIQVSVRGVYETPPLLPIDRANTDRFEISRLKVLGPIEQAPEPQHPLDAVFARAGERLIELEGMDSQVSEGRRALTLHWRCLKLPDRDYTLFIHVLDADGKIIYQQDAQPVQGAYPTSMWDAGESILDQHVIDWPARAATLRLGWYAASDGVRLEAFKPDGSLWPDNSVVLDAHLVN